MDNLPEILTAVCNLLPWKDRLTSRRLTTKFRVPRWQMIDVPLFTMEEENVGPA